jgi:hypothetical protein
LDETLGAKLVLLDVNQNKEEGATDLLESYPQDHGIGVVRYARPSKRENEAKAPKDLLLLADWSESMITADGLKEVVAALDQKFHPRDEKHKGVQFLGGLPPGLARLKFGR